MWLNVSTTPDSLRKMNLIEKYEVIKQLNENRFITDLIAKVKKTIPPFYGQRMEGSMMKVYSDNYIYEYQCQSTNDSEITIIYDRRVINSKQPFLPIIWKKDINKPFVTIQINEENYKRYQGHVLLNFKNKTTQQQKETANQLYNMNNFRLSVKNRKTLTYKEAEIAKYFIWIGKMWKMFEFQYQEEIIWKIDTRTNVITKPTRQEGMEETFDFVKEGKLYTYTPNGDFVTEIKDIPLIRSY